MKTAMSFGKQTQFGRVIVVKIKAIQKYYLKTKKPILKPYLPLN